MTGRVRRRLGLAYADTHAAQRAANATHCALCARLLGLRTEWHHVVPRSEGGRDTVPVHAICHRAIHATLSNAELARAETLEAIRSHPAIARFIAWIADKPVNFHAPTRSSHH
jgi:5-methylcytosine-specific restriction endonuclease McrA